MSAIHSQSKGQVKKILAVETSCDDTSVAIVNENGMVVAMTSANQDEIHAPFGGIVPEIAGRAHSEKLLHLIEQTLVRAHIRWTDISALAVTNRPGLVGSLLVGLVTVKTLAWALSKPYIAINHIEGHIWAPFVYENDVSKKHFLKDFLSLVVSGGHTQLVHVQGVGKYKVLGQTIDDAAGEAFDKFAKMIGLGYPGGYVIDQKAKQGDVSKYNFPRPMLNNENLNFSFSGLKTAAMNQVHQMSWPEVQKNTYDLCASYQEAIVDVLMAKLKAAIEQVQPQAVTVTGGVAANSRLRELVLGFADKNQLPCYFPDHKFCTDNAAMVGYAGMLRILKGEESPQNLGPSPRSLDEDFC